MTLSWPVVGAVLFAALLHASWNALVKSSQDKDLDMATIHLIGSFMAIPLVALVGWPKAEAWPFIAASVVIHIGYYLALTGAYRHGDLGLTYPLMRGVAPLLVALSATFTLGETLSPLAWAGVIGISCGVLVLGLNRHALEAPKAVAFALANAVIIAVYTRWSTGSVCARRAMPCNMSLRSSSSTAGHSRCSCLPHADPRSAATPVHRWPLATIGACASLGSYGIALWAMTRAPVATVAALRETSVLFAVLLGVWFLKEALTRRRVFGAAMIASGVMALRMG
jgi:phosphonate utilization associated putative membrane protein